MRMIKMKLVTMGAAVVLGVGACATTPAARTAGTVIDDAAITATVKGKLIGDEDTKARQINVETSKGVVQLNGFVDSDGARNEAARLASSVDGVKTVRNNLVVRTAERTVAQVAEDVEVTAKVDAALAADARTSALAIDVATRGGTVQLSGFVKSQMEKSAAAEVAKATEGVVSVKNDIDIR